MTTDLTATLAALAKMQDGEGFEEAGDPAAWDIKAGDIVHRPTEDAPLPAAISERTGPGWVTLYNTRTHEALSINRWNVEAALKKKHTDPAYPEFLGKPLFSRKPLGVRVLGQYKCWLHRDDPRRAEFDRRGYPTCVAGHLASEIEVMRHMRGKHKSVWAALDEERRGQEHQETLELQRQQIAVMTSFVSANGGQQATPVVQLGEVPKPDGWAAARAAKAKKKTAKKKKQSGPQAP